MDALTAISRMEVPTLVINHCSDVGCSHPSCWASRKLYRRNAYLLMLKGVPPSEMHPQEQSPARQAASRRAAEIPTQKVHNLVDELFSSVGGHSFDADDWQSATGGGGRGISAGQLSIKHMPTPMSSLSRHKATKSKRGHRVVHSEGNEVEEEDPAEDEENEEESEEEDEKDLPQRRQGRSRPVAKQRVLRLQDISQQQQGEAGRQFAALHQHSREYVWVPNPNRKPREGPLRSSDPDPALGRVNINEELSQFLQEDNYNQRQAALQERAVERSHLSTARVQRFFKSLAPASAARHVDLFKLPSGLLSEVLRSVDQGEPMTNESLVRMVEQAAETPGGPTASTQAQAQQAPSSDFERHVLRQRRAQLHNSESGRNLREPQKHTARAPVFLLDSSGVEVEKRRLPPIEAASGRRGDKQQGKGIAKMGGSSKRVVGQFKRSVGNECQLMLGPVSAESTPPASASMSARSKNSSAGSVSMAVECRSDRSTLLDEVLPSRRPGGKDSTLTALLAMNRPTYDLDDPWGDADAYHAEAPHPTTRDGTRLTVATSSINDDEGNVNDDINSAAGAVCLSLTTPVPDAAPEEDLDNEERDEDKDTDGRDSGLLAAPATGPVPPPPSPDVMESASDARAVRATSPPPSPQRRPAGALSSKSKSAASSGQLMPTLNEDEEVNE